MASRLRPEDVQEHLILAELYETLEKTDEAVAEHQRILEVDPTNINARRGLSRLQGIER